MQSAPLLTLKDKMKIPQLGFGMWQVPDEEAPKLLDHALAIGYRSIDTAAIYGNEAGTGKALEQMKLKREEVYVTTKVWNSDQGYDATLRAMDESLKKLKTSYVDLYLIHWPAPKQDKYLPTWKALARLHKEGLARSIGVSNFAIEHLEKIIQETGIIPAVNQIELHPQFQQKELRKVHAHYGIQTEAWSPLAQGQFVKLPIIQELAAKYNKTPAQIVLRWHMENNIVAIPKTVTPSRMLENFSIFDFKLDADDLQKMESLDRVDGRVGPDPMTADF